MRALAILILCGLSAIVLISPAQADTGVVPAGFVKGFNFTSTHYNEYRGCGYGPPIFNGPFYGPPISTSYAAPPVVHEKVIVNEVVAPVAVPVVVPATVFQYLPAIAPQAPSTPSVIGTGGTVAAAGAAAAPAVPVASTTPTVAVPASATAPVPATPVAAGLEAKLDLLIKARLDAIMRDKIATTADAPPPLADPDSAEQPTNYSTPLPTDTTTRQTGTRPDNSAPFQVAPPVTQAPAMADLQTRAMTVIGNACVACHKQGTEKGGITLVNAGNQWAPSKDGAPLSNEVIARSVETSRMPKLNATLHNQPLESAAKNDLLAWLRRQYAAR